MTAIALPTLLWAKVPAWVRFTTSLPITPTRIPPVMVAVVLRSYTLSAATEVPPTVKAFAVIVATFLVFPLAALYACVIE